MRNGNRVEVLSELSVTRTYEGMQGRNAYERGAYVAGREINRGIGVVIDMKLISKFFNELTTTELYEILKARAEIFTVEQQILYQDMDDIDYHSLHVFFVDDDKVLAYFRAFIKETNVVQLGRVLTIKHGTGLGEELLGSGIEQVRFKYNPERIYLESQSYAIGFYEVAGFKVCSEEFMEAGIPHVKMELEL